LRAVTPPAGESGFGTWCGAPWTNPRGSRALAARGTQGEINDGRFARAALHYPAPKLYRRANFFAW